MTFEIRYVPPGWEHPRNKSGRFIPLWDGALLKSETEDWDLGARRWEEGFRTGNGLEWVPHPPGDDGDYEDWVGRARPNRKDYTPVFPEGTATQVMLYENITEGTPLSPGFASLPDLAEWLAQADPEATLGRRATREQWLSFLEEMVKLDDPESPAP